jgi:hypothetical protein
MTGARGTISKSDYLSNLPGKHEIKEQKISAYWAQHTYCGKYQCKCTKYI